MNEHDDHTLRFKMRDGLRRGSFILGIKGIPPLHDFTDKVHQEYVRYKGVNASLRNTELWLNSRFGAPLPSITDALAEAQGALDGLKATTRDGMTYADNDLRIAWRKYLRPAMNGTIDALVNLAMVLLEESRKEGWFGTRTVLGRTVRISYRPQPDKAPDTLGLRSEFAFDDAGEFDEMVQVHPELRTVDFAPIARTQVSEHKERRGFDAEVRRMTERFPKFVGDMFQVEHGHKVEGQGETLSALLFHDTVIAVYDHPRRDEAHQSFAKPKEKKRKSILSALRNGAIFLLGLTALAASLYSVFSSTRSTRPDFSSTTAGRHSAAPNQQCRDAPIDKPGAPTSPDRPDRAVLLPASPRQLVTESPPQSTSPRLNQATSTIRPGDTLLGSRAVNIKPIDGTVVYDSIMCLIEPELCSSQLAATREKYRHESSSETSRRMARYGEAFRLYDLCFAEYIQTIDAQSAEAERITERVAQERRQRRLEPGA